MIFIKVSIIIPVYNTSEYLGECLESVVGQSYKNLEIICVNDGSTDDSLTILEKYSRRNNNIKIINQANAGLSAARNTGLKNCSGEYIFFLDSDDFLYNSEIIELMVTEARINNLDLVIGNYNNYYSSQFSTKNKVNNSIFNTIKNGIELLEFGIKNKSINSVVWNRLYKNSLIKDEYFLPGLLYEDMEYTIRILLKARKTKYLDIITVNYRQRENSIMNSKYKLKNALDYINIGKHIIKQKGHHKFISTWISLCIFKAYKISIKLKKEEKSIVLKEIKTINNCYKYFWESCSWKHKIFSIMVFIYFKLCK